MRKVNGDWSQKAHLHAKVLGKMWIQIHKSNLVQEMGFQNRNVHTKMSACLSCQPVKKPFKWILLRSDKVPKTVR